MIKILKTLLGLHNHEWKIISGGGTLNRKGKLVSYNILQCKKCKSKKKVFL